MKHQIDKFSYIPMTIMQMLHIEVTDMLSLNESGAIQRIFFRPDRHCFFLNWIVVIDALGYVVFSRPGFLGRIHNNTAMR